MLTRLDLKNNVIGFENLRRITELTHPYVFDILGKPSRYPHLQEDEGVYAKTYESEGEVLYFCETLEDMLEVYSNHDGKTASVVWYTGFRPMKSANTG